MFEFVVMIVSKSISVGLLPFLVSLAYTATTGPRIVDTTSGIIKGQFASGTQGVSEYLGIPYAQPPVGERRWAPPEPFKGSSVIKATSFVSKIVLRIMSSMLVAQL